MVYILFLVLFSDWVTVDHSTYALAEWGSLVNMAVVHCWDSICHVVRRVGWGRLDSLETMLADSVDSAADAVYGIDGGVLSGVVLWVWPAAVTCGSYCPVSVEGTAVYDAMCIR